ncbi:hypothetical protein HYH03_017636 [Edaphochlamys debaryana]|uniref:Protein DETOXIFICATION n=1 Tax=Edaphochlamys debaryana TaxID=47281 RepID=A0A835XM70_9CHLO|nr:hypothetical protein HYH03_017636 [Edaphochlamys debaryana]|eukprot:KAG2483530.1 hypothetical protein HYH03_017636 [Edaphochlamys debaryana]
MRAGPCTPGLQPGRPRPLRPLSAAYQPQPLVSTGGGGEESGPNPQPPTAGSPPTANGQPDHASNGRPAPAAAAASAPEPGSQPSTATDQPLASDRSASSVEVDEEPVPRPRPKLPGQGLAAAAAALLRGDVPSSLDSIDYDKRPGSKTRIQNAIDIGSFSLPLAAQNVLGYSLNALSESLVGRLGAAALSASTLANSTYSLVGLSVVWGGAAGMETLCGQAYGAGNLRLMRTVLIRAVLVCWAVCVPIVALWSNAGPLLLALGQSPVLVAQSQTYLRALAPSMFAYVLAECVQTYLVVQGIVHPTTIAKAIVTVLGPVYYYGFMFWMDMGLVGAGYAYLACKGTNALLLLAWMGWKILRGESIGRSSVPGDPTASDGSDAEASLTDPGSNAPAVLKVPKLVGSSAAAGSAAVQDGSSMGPNPHEELLTWPLNANASAHEFSMDMLEGPDGSPVGSSGSAVPSSSGSGSSRTRIAAAAAAGAAALVPAGAAAAAAAAPTAAAVAVEPTSVVQRLVGFVPAVRQQLAEVLDPHACWEYIKFGIPAAVMSCLEWWAYEALVIMAGWLPNAEIALGCLGICLTVSGWVYMIPQAISTAACARVSNALGAGDPVAAKRNFQSAYALVFLTQLAVAACLLPNAPRVATFFCADPLAAALTSTLLPITALNTVGDGMNCVLNGILRACGRQALGARITLALGARITLALGARITLVAYWCCGLPLAYFAAFKMGMGVKGFVMAIGATSLTQSLIVGSVISRFDWAGEVRNSRELLSSISTSGASSSGGGSGSEEDERP